MVEFDTEVTDVIQRTHNVKSFRFRAGADTVFKPGQYFFVTIKKEGQSTTKHFSFSSSPTEKGYIEFTKRITQSPFSKALDVLRPGDWAHLRMSYGNFTLEGENGRIAFLSGGIGITPIRSMCKYVCDKGLQIDIALFYGNNTENDIVFKDDFDRMHAGNKNIRVVNTLTSPCGTGTWPGRTGYIDSAMIKEELPDYKERIFYICGPPDMVASLKNILKDNLRIKDTSIKYENFAGY